MTNEKLQVIQGSRTELYSALSEEIGFTIFPGEENLLKDPNAAGVKAGSHRIFRAHTASGRTYPIIVLKNDKTPGEFFI